jgi:hypothetical protein
MAFEPDDLEKEVTYSFKMKVKNCTLCPFSAEWTDLSGDFIGNRCTVLDKYIKLSDISCKIPDFCFLKKGKCVIKVVID